MQRRRCYTSNCGVNPGLLTSTGQLSYFVQVSRDYDCIRGFQLSGHDWRELGHCLLGRRELVYRAGHGCRCDLPSHFCQREMPGLQLAAAVSFDLMRWTMALASMGRWAASFSALSPLTHTFVP